MPIVEIKGVGKEQFPDGMSADSIREFLRKKYYQQSPLTQRDPLTPVDNVAAPYEPTLAERMGQGVSNALNDVEKMKKNNVHQADMLKEWVASGKYADYKEAIKPQTQFSTADALPMDNFDEIKALPYKEKAKLASEWKTGQPIKLNYARNTVSSKNYPAGMDFGQKIEPAGRYMNVDFDDKGFNKNIPDWEFGEIEFNNPIVLEHKSTNSTGWKKDLSEMFGGSTGKRLTNKLKKAGHDGIITKDADGFNETISLK